MAKLIVGCGYVGRRLAKTWRDAGEQVWATTRSAQRARDFEDAGLAPVLLDVTRDHLPAMPTIDTVVFAVGYDRTSPHRIQDVYVNGLQRVIASCPATVERFIYLSSTGVYGHAQGEWVDEQTQCEPVREGGKACFAAENLLRSDPEWKRKTIILRLAGIYGPDRLPQLAKILAGQPLPVAADGFLNLIHVDDIVNIICRIETKLETPDLLCVSDGQPVLRGEFYQHLAGLLQCPKPTFERPPAGSSQAERARGSKKVRNDRLVERIHPDWIYPSYREGLQAIVQQRRGS